VLQLSAVDDVHQVTESSEGKSICGSCWTPAFTLANSQAGACQLGAEPQHHTANNSILILSLTLSHPTVMYTPTQSSPRLELRPKRMKVERAIMDANRLVYEGKYTAALSAYDKLLEQRCHPVYYLNRALCFIATNQPHLAVNDALRAYIMAQSVIDAIRNKGEVNNHIRRIDAHIITYNGTSRLLGDTALVRYS
jgi:hypothetical protein